MKQMTSIFVVFLLLLLFTSCDSTEQNSGSETSMGLYNSTSNSESVSTTNNLNSKTTDEPTVASEDKTVTLENSSVSSVAMNPYVSQNERGEIIYINPAEEIFYNNDEIPEYLKRIDLREKGFDIIANEKIYLTPHIINSPKSRIGKTDIINTEISTAQGGGFFIRWSYFGADRKYLYSITWYTSANLTSNPINNAQELETLVKSYSGNGIYSQIITRENRYYVRVLGTLYWMYDNKYLISITSSVDEGDIDELILLAEDIAFDKHKLQ